jgi:S1-C subfamily serine protease
MKFLTYFILFSFGFIGLIKADPITLIELNTIIEQTNFIVERGCSGTLIDIKKKLILTNYHCVDSKIQFIEEDIETKDGFLRKVKRKKYLDIIVEQNGYSGFTKVSTSTYIGEIVAENKKVDLALIRIKSDIPHKIYSKLLPENEGVLRGEKVFVVGNPAGNDASLVEGVVSNLNRTFEFPWTDNEKLPMIQFSGGIYGGNSGGALYNERGYLIGVPAAGHSQANFIGLAIPINIVKTFLKNNCWGEIFDSSFANEDCLKKKKEKEKEKEKEKDT